jgi:hypothetical protein
MLDVFGFPTPQGANYQQFYGGGTVRDWVKPRGASMVRMLLIGAGAGGRAGSTSGGGTGGGSGAVTQWIGPAIFIPDVLQISIGAGGASGSAGTNTTIIYQAKNGTGYTLLTAEGAASNGIFKSIVGQNGSGTSVTAPTTTFLSGGAGGGGGAQDGYSVFPNYGYPQLIGGITGGPGTNGPSGYFLTQPIMLGVGGSGGGGNSNAGSTGNVGGNGGIGCGGGGGGRGVSVGGPGGRGGDGAVFIWSW